MEKICFDNIANINSYYNLRLKLYNIASKVLEEGNVESLEEAGTITTDPLLENIKQATSFTSKLLFCDIKILEANMNNDIEGLYNWSKNQKELYDLKPEKAYDNPKKYMDTITDFMSACIKTKKFDEFFIYAEHENLFLEEKTIKKYFTKGRLLKLYILLA